MTQTPPQPQTAVPPPSRGEGPYRIGPMVLGLVIGLQLTFWAWGRWLERKMPPAELAQLTSLGKTWYHPDHDRPIYALGIVVCLFLAAGLGAAWSRRFAGARSEDDLESLRTIALWHLPVAGFLALLRPPYFPARPLGLLAAGLGLAFCVAALRASRRPMPPMWRRLQTVEAFAARALPAIVAALLAVLVYIPSPARLVAENYAFDRLHHVDFYVMAPALAFGHGIALGTDFYAQYGVGWPVIVSWLSAVFPPLSYKLVIAVAVAWGCVYFFVLFLFLRRLLGSGAWAFAGLLLALALQLFSGTGGLPKWLWLSCTVMRYSMDIFLFSVLLAHATEDRRWHGPAAGAIAALAVLLGTDTGLYLALCLAVYAAAAPRLRRQAGRRREPGRFAASCLLGFAVVLAAGLAIASHGTLLQAQFWQGWTEALRLYSDGFSHLPAGDAIRNDFAAGLLLFLMLACYLFAVARALSGALDRQLAAAHLVHGVVGLYGLSTLLLFIGRSHPYNLHHVAVPFCVLATVYAAEALGGPAQRRAADAAAAGQRTAWRVLSKALPAACAYAVLVTMFSQPTFRNYPNALRLLSQGAADTAAADRADYLFASRRDAPLDGELRKDAAAFRAVAAAMRELSDGGRRTVAMIDGFDTAYLLESGLPPRFRYSPVLAGLWFEYQVELLEKQLDLQPPDYVVLPLAAPRVFGVMPTDDAHRRIVELVRHRFVFDRQVADKAIYRRQAKG